MKGKHPADLSQEIPFLADPLTDLLGKIETLDKRYITPSCKDSLDILSMKIDDILERKNND
jgi:hypothetical protein